MKGPGDQSGDSSVEKSCDQAEAGSRGNRVMHGARLRFSNGQVQKKSSCNPALLCRRVQLQGIGRLRKFDRRGSRAKRRVKRGIVFFVERLRGLKTPQRIEQSRAERMEVAARYKKDFVSYPLGAKDTKTTDHLKNVLVIAAIHHTRSFAHVLYSP